MSTALRCLYSLGLENGDVVAVFLNRAESRNSPEYYEYALTFAWDLDQEISDPKKGRVGPDAADRDWADSG